MPRLLYAWERNQSLHRRLCGPLSQSGHFGGEKNLLLLLGFKPLDCTAHSLVSIMTAQSWLPHAVLGQNSIKLLLQGMDDKNSEHFNLLLLCLTNICTKYLITLIYIL
jgi:hypothetical protein